MYTVCGQTDLMIFYNLMLNMTFLIYQNFIFILKQSGTSVQTILRTVPTNTKIFLCGL